MNKVLSAKAAFLLAIVTVLAILGFAGLKGTVNQTGKSDKIAKKNDLHSQKKSKNNGHFIYSDLLDNKDESGVTIEEALKKVNSDVSLPSSLVVGEIIKVVLSDQNYAETGKWGMGVLYDSGIKLWIQPGEEDLERTINEKVAPYSDSRENAFVRQNIGGRETLVGKGGFQIIDNENTRVRAHPILLWNKNGMKYQLRTNSDTVTVGDLKKAAESIK